MINFQYNFSTNETITTTLVNHIHHWDITNQSCARVKSIFFILIKLKKYLCLIKKVKNIRLNMFLVPINMSTFRFSPFKKFLQLLVLQKFFIFTFGPSFKVNSYVEFIFLNKILQKN